MKHEILTIGIQNLPSPIDSFTWEYALKERVNIADYDIVFIDFASFPYKEDVWWPNLNKILNVQKIGDALRGGIKLFIFVDRNVFLAMPIWTNTSFGVRWRLEEILLHFGVNLTVYYEKGKAKEILEEAFSDYYSLLKEWDCCFEVEKIRDSMLDIIPIAKNKAKRLLGVLLKKNLGLEELSGEVYILHTLGENSKKGLMEILKNVFSLDLTREEPEWSKRIEFERSKKIKKKIEKLEEEKNKLIQELQELNVFKKLLWETDRELESIVHKSFKLLSIDISEPTKSEEDGTFEYGSTIYVVEIEGAENRGAKFGKLSKLITRMQNIRIKCKKDVKGIFIINHYANFPPNERKNPFPDNVKKTAEVNNVKLLTTVELFEIIKNVIDGKLDKKEAINKILE